MGKALDWLRARKAGMLTLQQALLGVCVVLLQWLGAGAVGYWYAQSQIKSFVIEERADHLAEIERLQRTYADTLAVMSAKAKETAEATQVAAEQSAQAAVESKDAAKAAKRVATPAAISAPAITEAQRTDINKKIEAANKRLREKQ